MKTRIFAITQKDCREDHFRCGGHGGQNINKRDTGVRFTHEPSGAVGESREARTQESNRRIAWQRMANHPKMQAWIKVQAAAKMEGFANIEHKLDLEMQESNLRIETGENAVACLAKETYCDKMLF